MAHSKSALKRWRQNETHRARNKPVRTAARTAVKKAHVSIAEGDSDAAAAIREAASILDRAAKHNVIHKNAVARHKSRMARQLNRASGPATDAPEPKRVRKVATKTTAKPKTAAKTKTSTKPKATAKPKLAAAKPRATKPKT